MRLIHLGMRQCLRCSIFKSEAHAQGCIEWHACLKYFLSFPDTLEDLKPAPPFNILEPPPTYADGRPREDGGPISSALHALQVLI